MTIEIKITRAETVPVTVTVKNIECGKTFKTDPHHTTVCVKLEQHEKSSITHDESDALYRCKGSSSVRTICYGNYVYPCHPNGTLFVPAELERVIARKLPVGKFYEDNGELFMVVYHHGDSISVLNMASGKVTKINNQYFDVLPVTITSISGVEGVTK